MKLQHLKTLIILLIIYLLPIGLKGQSTSDLDDKRGFKDFKLGDPYIKLAASIQYISGDKMGGEMQYLYTGNCCTTLFDFNVARIHLIFLNQTLVSILVELEIWDKPSENNFTDYTKASVKWRLLNDNFTTLFNKATNYYSDPSTGTLGFIWETNKTFLYTDFKLLGPHDGCATTVTIGDISALKMHIKGGG